MKLLLGLSSKTAPVVATISVLPATTSPPTWVISPPVAFRERSPVTVVDPIFNAELLTTVAVNQEPPRAETNDKAPPKMLPVRAS